MATKGMFSLKGMEEYLETLATADGNVDEATARAVMAGAEVAEAGMVKRAPELTGNLKSKIAIKGPDRDGNFHFAEIGLIHDKNFTDAETARYGMAQEFGSASMPAHPYIRPTLKRDKSKIRKAERESLEKDAIL